MPNHMLFHSLVDHNCGSRNHLRESQREHLPAEFCYRARKGKSLTRGKLGVKFDPRVAQEQYLRPQLWWTGRALGVVESKADPTGPDMLA